MVATTVSAVRPLAGVLLIVVDLAAIPVGAVLVVVAARSVQRGTSTTGAATLASGPTQLEPSGPVG